MSAADIEAEEFNFFLVLDLEGKVEILKFPPNHVSRRLVLQVIIASYL